MTALLGLGFLASGCAWTNPDNRPVWNAFEEHLVPEDDVAFAVTLPLTVPGGFGAILLDTLIVHPLQVVDDAAGNARDVWKGMKWSSEYYTELATLPLRGLGTPIVFVGSFLGRCMFDIDPRTEPRSAAEIEQAEKIEGAARRLQVQRWLESLAAGRSDPWPLECSDCRSWNEELDASFAAARLTANSAGRLELYEAAERNGWPPWQADPTLGLRDPDPVVRYLVLQRWSGRQPIPDDLQRDLRSDPSEMVRLLAQKLFPAHD